MLDVRTLIHIRIVPPHAENMQKLGQASRDELGLSALNGIKALSMICIIGGHAILFMVGGPQLNTDFYAREINLLRNAFLLNSPLLVDTFLLLSGFLFAHLVLVELEKRRGRVNFGLLYVFRYVRLTPAYLAVIAVYATWLPRLGSGPLWQARMGLEQERCRQSWWLNVLYVNNYVGTADIVSVENCNLVSVGLFESDIGIGWVRFCSVCFNRGIWPPTRNCLCSRRWSSIRCGAGVGPDSPCWAA